MRRCGEEFVERDHEVRCIWSDAPAQGVGQDLWTLIGWVEIEFRSMLHESVRLNRTIRFGHFWLWLSRRAPKKMQEEGRRLSGVVLLASRERNAASRA